MVGHQSFVLACAMLATVGSAWGDTYVCGKEVSGQVFAACKFDQFKIGSNGARTLVPKTQSTIDAARTAEEARVAMINIEARARAERNDRQLLAKFPDEAVHRKAQEDELKPARDALARSEEAIRVLAAEREPLEKQNGFFPNGKGRPQSITSGLEANDAKVLAQTTIQKRARDEEAEINARYKERLVRLKKLWAGAPPGSLGEITGPDSAPTSK
jgi:hypothetical protein